MKNIKMALIAGICASSFALSGCFAVNMAEEQPPSLNEETTSIYTEQSAPPTDGSSPAAYSGLENVAFMAYRLANGQYYSSEATSEVKTSIGFITYTQQVETYKDYYDGVMVVSDVSKSTLVNNALQSCFIGDRVLWRSPASSKPKDWNGRATAWKESSPTNRSLDEYMQLYGLPSTEFSVYTLNAQTLSKWSSVTDNGDGTYSQTIYPDVSTAGVYYSIRMKTMGGLSSYPTFQEISITYTFDRSWRVLSSVTEELYSVDLGVIHSDSCKAVTTQTYSYDRSKVDISAYTDFFSRFEQKKDDDVIDTPLEDEPVTSMTATDYLLQGCGPLLTGAQMFAVQATYNETEIAGSLYVNLASGEARGTIEGINVWYTDSKLYLGTGDAIVYLSPSKFTALAATFGGKGSSFNILGLLGDFQSAQIEENDLTVTVTASLNVSDSVLQTAFFFDRTEDGVVLNYVRIDTTAGDAAVSITLTVSDEEPIPALTAAQKAGATDISDALEYLGGLQTMIANKKLAITAAISTTVNGKTYEFDVSGNVDWSDGIKLSATVQTELFGSLREVTFYYIDGEISVVCGKIGVQMYVSDLEDIAAAVQEAAARVAELWNSSSEESQALGGAAVALAAVMEKVAQSGAFDQEEAVAWVKSVLQSLLQAAAQGAQGVKDAFALTYDGTAFTLTANGWEILGAPIGFTATLAAGKTSPALPQNVTMVTAEQFKQLWDHISDLGSIEERNEWNIGYTMSVFDGDEAYASYDYLRYSVTGELQYVRDLGNLSATLSAESTCGEKNYYLTLTVFGGTAYLSVSYYKDTDALYEPLRLSGKANELSEWLTANEKTDGESFVYNMAGTLLKLASAGAATYLQSAQSITLGGLQIDQTGVYVTLPNAFYGSGDISLQLSKNEGAWSLSFGNVGYKDATHARIDGEITLKTTPCSIVAPAGEYMDVSVLARLATAASDSFLDWNGAVPSLLERYYFGGNVSCSIGEYDLSFDVGANFTLSDGVKLNLSIGAKSSFAVNSGRYLSYVTIDLPAGMVYMTRYQYEYYNLLSLSFRSYASPVVTYRSMTLDEFAADAWNQIVYLTNMGDAVSALLATQVGGAIGSGSVSDWNSAANTQRDVGGYLKEFSYDEQAKTFRIVVNGAALSDDLGDMTLQIACNDEGKIANMYGSFSLVASFSVNIDYENVTATDGDYTLSLRDLKETWAKENYTMTVMSGVTESASSVLGVAEFTSTVTLQNGKKKYTVPVQYGAPMSELFDLEDTETARFRGWFTEENGDGERITAETCDNGLGGKTLYAYWENYITIRLDAGEGKADASSVKETPTDLWQALQSVNVSAREGYSFAGWQDEEGNFVTAENIADYARDGVTLYAAYEKSLYVTLRSDITFTVNGETDETKAVDTYSYYRKDGETIPAATAEGYLFVGWFVNTEDGWAVASDELCAQDAVTLWAVWLKDDLNVTITTCSLSTFKLWTIKGSYAGGGFAEGMSQTIASAVGYEQTTEVWYRLSNDGETVRDTLNSGKSVTVSGGTFSKSSMSSLLGGTYGGATVRITYVIGGITVTVEASGYKQK